MFPLSDDAPARNRTLAPYAGRWVALLRGEVIGQGGTPEQALIAARFSHPKETPEICFVPMETPWNLPPLLMRIRAALPPEQPIYLVGGAVRDLLLEQPVHDFDFILPGETLRRSRLLADRLGAAYYPLDAARNTARVVLVNEDGTRDVLDFAALRAPDLEGDLRDRDFSINAMAVNLRDPDKLLDPLGGAADLRAKRLRACSSAAMRNDPVRVLRAIRLAAALDLHIETGTRQWMREAVPGLTGISAERQRDELMKILNGPRPHAALRALDLLGALPYTLPELESLKGVDQSAPHTKDVWEHTLDTLRALARVLDILTRHPAPDEGGSLLLGELSLHLGRYRRQVREHLADEFVPDRPARGLLFFAALYHDVAKPQTRSVDVNSGRVRFLGHDTQGAGVAASRARHLRLSNEEITRIRRIVQHHMRPILLANENRKPSKRAVYRFFRDSGAAGVDICLLSLADVAAAYGPALPAERWHRQVEVVRRLLEAWWEQPHSAVSPPALINGKDLIELGMRPGPMIGEILNAVRLAQVDGQVRSRSDALKFARKYLQG